MFLRPSDLAYIVAYYLILRKRSELDNVSGVDHIDGKLDVLTPVGKKSRKKLIRGSRIMRKSRPGKESAPISARKTRGGWGGARGGGGRGGGGGW